MPERNILCPIRKPMGPGKFALREQLRFGFQPMLNIVPGQ